MNWKGLKRAAVVICFMFVFICTNIPAEAAEGETGTANINVKYGQTEARKMLDMVNAFRTGNDAWEWDSDDKTKIPHKDLVPLEYDYELEKVAMQRAAEIAFSYYPAHYRPDGSLCLTAYPNTHVYMSKGENIAAGYETAESVFVGWREDDENYAGQGHRRNMLNKDFTAIGIGHVYYNGYHYWVQEFGSPASGAAQTAANDGETTVSIDFLLSEATITLTPDVSSITVASGQSAALPNLDIQIKMNGIYPNWVSATATADYQWTVANGQFASINNGQVTGLADGTTTLTATVFGQTVTVNLMVGTGNNTGDNGSNGGNNTGSNGNNNGSNGGNTGTGDNNGGNAGTGDSSGVNNVTGGTWQQNGSGWWYQNPDGSWPAGGWQMINGTWYAFDENGYMREGWFWNGFHWYYLMPGSGAMAEGWLRLGNTWYYMTPGSGAMSEGWTRVGNTWYYMAPGSGAMAEGWQYINNTWYYLIPGSGAMAEGWARLGSTWYYLTPGSGAMAEGWQYINNTWYYMTPGSGVMAEGWQNINNTWYYLIPDSGMMAEGWARIGNTWYYLTPGSGAMAEGWVSVDNIWYYLTPKSGAMASNTWIGNYYVNGSGAWTRTR